MSFSESVVKKEDPNAAKSHPQYSLLDIRKKDEQVWYARIPQILFDDWSKIQKSVQIGEVTITPQPNTAPKLTVHFLESAVSSFPYELLPKVFNLVVQEKADANRYFFSHKKDTGIVRLLGRVNVEVDLKGDIISMSKIRTYLDDKIKKSKKREKFVDGDIPIPEPSENMFSFNTKIEKKKKDKRIRKSQDMIKREVLENFKKNPEWKIKDLAKIIDQDQKFIRPIVAQVAEYDQKTNTYHLREDLE